MKIDAFFILKNFGRDRNQVVLQTTRTGSKVSSLKSLTQILLLNSNLQLLEGRICQYYQLLRKERLTITGILYNSVEKPE